MLVPIVRVPQNVVEGSPKMVQSKVGISGFIVLWESGAWQIHSGSDRTPLLTVLLFPVPGRVPATRKRLLFVPDVFIKA